MKKFYMKILLWIQGWSGQLNSWAWTEWDRFHRKDQERWAEDYRRWNDKQEKIKLFDDEENKKDS